MIELPDFGALRVTQGAVKPTKRDYDSVDQLTIALVPKGRDRWRSCARCRKARSS